MTNVEFILDTVRFYTEDPDRRAYHADDGSCVYLTDNGNKCAVGRCFSQYGLDHYGHYVGTLDDLYLHINEDHSEIDKILDDQYSDLDWMVMTMMQDWHDNVFNYSMEHNRDHLDKVLEIAKAPLEAYKELDTILSNWGK